MRGYRFKRLFMALVFLILTAAQSYGGSISGTVYLAPELRHRVSPTDTVYVIAQAEFGPREPLAMVRGQVRDLPMEFTLDDSKAKMPGLNLSSFPEVSVIGWVTKSGFAYLESGDYQGRTSNVRTSGGHVKVIINRIVQ